MRCTLRRFAVSWWRLASKLTSHVLAIARSAAANIGVHSSHSIIIFPGYMPGSRSVGSYGSPNFPGSLRKGDDPFFQPPIETTAQYD